MPALSTIMQRDTCSNMPPKKGRQSPARFMPYLPPNTPRRDWELQNAEVRAIAANRTLPSSTIEHLEATSSTMKQHESVGFAGDMVTPDLGRDESSYAPEPDLSISLPLATAGERVLIDHCEQYTTIRNQLTLCETSAFYYLR